MLLDLALAAILNARPYGPPAPASGCKPCGVTICCGEDIARRGSGRKDEGGKTAATFNPEPNLPPVGTGGTGTRFTISLESSGGTQPVPEPEPKIECYTNSEGEIVCISATGSMS